MKNKQEKVRDNTYHMESASTAASAFFIYPAKSTNAIKYHVSKLHLMNNFTINYCSRIIKIKLHMKHQRLANLIGKVEFNVESFMRFYKFLISQTTSKF